MNNEADAVWTSTIVDYLAEYDPATLDAYLEGGGEVDFSQESLWLDMMAARFRQPIVLRRRDNARVFPVSMIGWCFALSETERERDLLLTRSNSEAA